MNESNQGLGRALRSLARAVSWHRRKLAVVAAVLAVLTGINAAAPRPPDASPVLRAVDLVAGGDRLTADLVRLELVPVDAIPEGALTDPAQALGRTVAAAIPQGQVLTEHDLVGKRSVSPGRVLTPVRLADPGLGALLRPGDQVDIVATDGQNGAATIVAPGARIVTIPASDDQGTMPRSDSGSGVLLLVEVDTKTATALAEAGSTSALTVLWR